MNKEEALLIIQSIDKLLGNSVQEEELQEAQMIQQQMQAMGAQNPAMAAGMMQNPQMMQSQQRLQQITNQIESRKAKLIAEMQEDFAKEEEKIMGEFGGDPLLRLKGREIDLRAQENQRKEEEGQERLDLDKMRAMMNQQNTDEKIDQNEKLANLRADTSIEKTILQNELKKE